MYRAIAENPITYERYYVCGDSKVQVLKAIEVNGFKKSSLVKAKDPLWFRM